MVLRNTPPSLPSALALAVPQWMQNVQLLLCFITCCGVLGCLPLPQKLHEHFGINVFQAALQALAYIDAVTRHLSFLVGMYLGAFSSRQFLVFGDALVRESQAPLQHRQRCSDFQGGSIQINYQLFPYGLYVVL
jgi:hypothetical protein